MAVPHAGQVIDLGQPCLPDLRVKLGKCPPCICTCMHCRHPPKGLALAGTINGVEEGAGLIWPSMSCEYVLAAAGADEYVAALMIAFSLQPAHSASSTAGMDTHVYGQTSTGDQAGMASSGT